jgi:hypothetical protein
MLHSLQNDLSLSTEEKKKLLCDSDKFKWKQDNSGCTKWNLKKLGHEHPDKSTTCSRYCWNMVLTT